jgi:hypothetical protein
MRRALPLLLAAAVAVPAGGAAARPVPVVSHDGCTLDVFYDQATCHFTLLPGATQVTVIVFQGSGWATVSCPNSGYAETVGGGPGVRERFFTATADVCTLSVDAREGHVRASVG